MANLILLNVSKRTVGSVSINNGGINTNNVFTYSPTQQFALDILNLATPIRSNPDGTTYFNTRNNASQQIENRNVGITSWVCTDTLSTFSSQSQDLVSLTVAYRNGVALPANENMLFQTSKIIEIADIDPATGHTRFSYSEDGEANLVIYEVTQSPSSMVSGGISPVFNMDGRDLYVNDIVGNDATAEKGNPLLPWLTVTAALTAASVGDVVVILEGAHTVANLFKADVDVEVRSNTVLTITGYNAGGVGSQNIYGGGTITTTGVNGFRMTSTFDGLIKVDVGTVNLNGSTGGNNLSTAGGVFDFNADYVNIGAACFRAFNCTGNGTFNWRVRVKQTDSGTIYRGGLLISASSPNASGKTFDIKVNNGTCNASNEGFLLVNAIDSTYVVDIDCNLVYDGSAGLPCFDAVVAAYNCTGGQIIMRGNYAIVSGRHYISVDSTLRIHDSSVAYQSSGNTESVIAMAGGNSTYNYYGRKKSFALTEAINLGTFTGANNSNSFGAISSTGGTDTLNFKGGLQCATLNVSAVGILVTNGATGLLVDGGSIEMVNSNTLNDAISATSPENIRVYGTGFVRGAVNGNITNIITGSNIIQDTNVTVHM